MKMFLPAPAVVAALLSRHGAAVLAFAPAPSLRAAVVAPSAARATAGPAPRPLAPSPLRAARGAEGEAGAARPSRRARLLSALRRRARPVSLAVLASAALGGGPLLAPPAHASAPIVLRPAMKKKEPPMQKALEQAAEAKKQKSMAEFDAHVARCNDVEKREGKAARAEFEREYHAERARAEAQKVIDVETLQRKLLDLGQDPYTEPDAQREVFLLEHDVDLRKVIGTDQNRLVAQNFIKQGKAMRKGGGKAEEVPSSTEAARFIVAAQVADLKAQGVDPLPHFLKKEVREETRRIYKMDKGSAERAAAKYRTLMRRFGRLTPSQEGEVPFVYVPKSVEEVAATPKKLSATEERRARAAQRTAEKETARVARHAAKAEKKAQKLSAKSQKRAEKAAAQDAAQEAVQAEEAAGFEAGAVVAAEAGAAVAAAAAGAPSAPPLAELAEPAPPSQLDGAGSMVAKIKVAATPRNGVAVVVGGGAVAFGVNYLKENSGAAQKERERQLRLILGDDEDEEDDDEEDDEDDDEYEQFTKQQMSPEPPQAKPETDKSTIAPDAATPPLPTPPVAAPPAKPKRLGIFSKRNANARETNLNALVKPAAQAPAFATLLAQLLAFGAPGRFPAVASWGPAPLDDFELDEAKALLVAARGENAALSDDATSAGVFAAVVNCMLIDIVDLASSTLKGKKQEEKVTVDALNVVMDFMDHAASLFDAVAEDVTIKPVVYGGKLRKKDLEQMFSMYAGSSMMSMDALTGGGSGGGANQDRVDTLQLVFAITDKKAEGLMQKHMMKMMMNLMKDGGEGLEGMKGMPGMEGMEDMAAMLGGGAEGMPGMPGMDGGEMSMEDLKQTLDMMKDMKDSGQVSEAELVEIRKQFKDLYGSDVSGLIKKAEEEGTAGGMTDDEKELLDMFKWILGEE